MRQSQKIVQMAEVALMSAVLCVISPFSIPVPMSPVPMNLALFGVHLTAVLLGAKNGAVSVMIYLLLGAVGVPVFSGFSGGIGVLLGPTGGYLFGYVPCVLLTGWLGRRAQKSRFSGKWQLLLQGSSMAAGTVVCYILGTAWFLMIMQETYTLSQALLVCVVPYLLFDFMKILAAAAIAMPLQRIVRRIEQ